MLSFYSLDTCNAINCFSFRNINRSFNSCTRFFYGKGIVRVARAATHDVIAKDFIVSARARGHSNMSIIWNEIIPNVRDAILVEGAMRWSWMLLGFSSLSFLGFGVSPPTPDWG